MTLHLKTISIKWLLSAFIFSSCVFMGGPQPSLVNFAVRDLSYWDPFRKGQTNQRIFAAPHELVTYLNDDNYEHGIEKKTESVAPTPEMKKDIESALSSIPKQVWRLLDNKFIGIFLVKNLGASGFVDFATKKNGETGYFIALDVHSLNKNANDWLQWKEQSAFLPSNGVRLTAQLEDASEDTRVSAIRFLLLHEMGHIVAEDYKIVPSWRSEPSSVTHPENYTFFGLSWYVQENRYERQYELTEQLPGELLYYSNEPSRPRLTRAAEFYSWIEQTNFPTLYAATSPHEDFAESFATYVHSQILDKPYAILLNDAGKNSEFTLCWGLRRCREKFSFLKTLFDSK